MAGVANEQ